MNRAFDKPKVTKGFGWPEKVHYSSCDYAQKPEFIVKFGVWFVHAPAVCRNDEL